MGKTDKELKEEVKKDIEKHLKLVKKESKKAKKEKKEKRKEKDVNLNIADMDAEEIESFKIEEKERVKTLDTEEMADWLIETYIILLQIIMNFTDEKDARKWTARLLVAQEFLAILEELEVKVSMDTLELLNNYSDEDTINIARAIVHLLIYTNYFEV